MEILEEVKCFHCGEDCEESHHQVDEKAFCCLGCKTVYQLLEENDLCTYYDLGKTPGNQLKDFFVNKYNFLENAEIADQLLDFDSPEYRKITFDIPSIHCSSCIWLLENLSRFDEGIIHSRINFGAKRLTIDFRPQQTNVKSLVELLCQLGYEPEITLDRQSNKETHATHKSTFIKLGVSGFAYGNIMLFSFPEYFGINIDSEFIPYFGYLNLALSLFVLMYCAQEFFISAYKGLSKKILNIDLPIAMGILALFVRSSYEIISQTGAGYFDSMAALVFLLLIGRWFQGQTYRKLSFDRNYKSYFPLAVYRIKNQEKKSVLVETLQVGDRIEIRNHEIVPCDSILIDPITQIDYSFVTGESQSVQVTEGEKIYAGGRINGTAVRMDILQVVSHSYLTQLWNNDVFSKESHLEEHLIINQVSRYFTPIILAIAVTAAIVWAFIDGSGVLNVFSSVLIIACPCALALTAPFTLGSVLNLLAKHQFYLKNTEVIERMWKTTHIVFDKTGTITNSENATVAFLGDELTQEEKCLVAALVVHSTHPLSQAIYTLLESQASVQKLEIMDFEETKGKGLSGKINGKYITIGSALSIGLPQQSSQLETRVYLKIDHQIKGYFGIQNSYRKGLKQMLDTLQSHFDFTILSGDNPAEAQNLEVLFPPHTNLYFDQSPVDKLNKINRIEENQNCIMVGDGLNDAGALKASTVGISISDSLSSFTPASDAILQGKRLVQLADFMLLIRQAKVVIVIGFVISFAYNIIGLSFAVAGMVTPIFAALLMPISSISVVGFTTLSIKWLGRRIL
ncbi:heavy metal translocating P-type ATPase metal-binding domain-containing protein [Reichenbachiella agarivorans]|uniref:Heavy metal translocating P-type ATPase metal-binding domain-containing protein n=1 Tax=Reichenbachiella agarivorans TaxID=2979464 RepID=A0ABY6CLN1_9BACT|nr:heavy metal translocating P-type ATPase metal-binding domain-containing protein [Reichenbachiella agarivorans]UXP31430.1 heavy metal translocating P-type ATPase metal-binding domain-containing protein [Reichenbachiella agarivorans]